MALRSGGATLITTIVAAVAAAGIWIGLASWRHAMGLAESYAYLAGLLMLTVGITSVVARLLRRTIPAGPDALGVTLVWWALGMLLAISAPGMSYVFTLPALAGGLMLIWSPSLSGRCRLVRWALMTCVVLVLLVPAIDIFYQLAQPRPGNPDSQILPFIVIPILLVALVVELLRVFRVRPAQHRSPVRSAGIRVLTRDRGE